MPVSGKKKPHPPIVVCLGFLTSFFHVSCCFSPEEAQTQIRNPRTGGGGGFFCSDPLLLPPTLPSPTGAPSINHTGLLLKCGKPRASSSSSSSSRVKQQQPPLPCCPVVSGRRRRPDRRGLRVSVSNSSGSRPPPSTPQRRLLLVCLALIFSVLLLSLLHFFFSFSLPPPLGERNSPTFLSVSLSVSPFLGSFSSLLFSLSLSVSPHAKRCSSCCCCCCSVSRTGLPDRQNCRNGRK